MPAIRTVAPESFQFVLIHPRLDASPKSAQPLLFASYSETLNSISIQLENEDVHRHAIFCHHRATRDRAVKEGWVDVTSAFVDRINATRPKVTTPSQQAVYAALTADWQTKSEIVSASGITDSEWRTTIRLLEDRGIAKVNITKNKRAKASNRAYRYTRGERYDDALIAVE